jgi:hypothetical protein
MKPIQILAFLLLPAALWGCSADLMATNAGAPEMSVQAQGEALLFVGTEPSTLSTDLYLVRAASSEQDNPSIAAADSYELERLTDTAGGNDGILGSEGDRLFSDSMPHPVPDRAGNRVVLLAANSNADSSQSLGRIVVIDLLTRTREVSPDIPGLLSARFTDLGDWLVLEQLSDSGRQQLLLVPADDLGAEPVSIDLSDADLHQEFAGVINDSNDFLVLGVQPEVGTSGVYRVSADSADDGAATLLSAGVDGLITEPSLNRDGTLLALTLTQPGDQKRSIIVVPSDGGPEAVTDILDADCYWPSWSPAADAKLSYRLSFVCKDMMSSRPDIGMWSSASLEWEGMDSDGNSTGPNGEDPADLLTDVSQPAIFEGTMDGLVVRSRPQWDPTGEALVFGVSTAAEAYSGEGMTLLVLPIGGTAYSVYSGSGTSVDWAHFSGSADERNLLLWERTETGLEETSSVAPGAQPIRVIDIAQPDPVPTYVRLGQDLLVSYPMFVGANSLFYP